MNTFDEFDEPDEFEEYALEKRRCDTLTTIQHSELKTLYDLFLAVKGWYDDQSNESKKKLDGKYRAAIKYYDRTIPRRKQ